jgi:hypothetical protein
MLISSAACEYFCGAPYRDTVAFVIDPILVAILIAQVVAFRKSIVWKLAEPYLAQVSWPRLVFDIFVPTNSDRPGKKDLGSISGDSSVNGNDNSCYPDCKRFLLPC